MIPQDMRQQRYISAAGIDEQSMNRRAGARLMALGLFVVALLSPLFAASPIVLRHAQYQPVLPVAQLELESQGGNAAPWLLPVLNRCAVKPAGWRWENPLAPEGTTGDEPAYWATALNEANLDRLARCRLLLLPWAGTAPLTAREGEMLRGLLRQGVSLWVDYTQAVPHPAPLALLSPEIILADGPYQRDAGVALQAADPESALLSGRLPLSEEEIAALAGYAREDTRAPSALRAGVAGQAGSEASPLTAVVRLRNGDPVIAAGQVGAGWLIVSAANLSGAIAGWRTDPRADLAMPPDLAAQRRAYTAACKLVMNLFPPDAAGLPPRLSPATGLTDPALSAPTGLGPYIAVISGGTIPELRVYRRCRLDDAGLPLAWPYGQYDEYGRLVTPDRVPARPPLPEGETAGAPPLPGDALECCFAVPAKGWTGTPALGRIPQVVNTLTADGKVTTRVMLRTVVVALEAQEDGACRPRCFALDPFIARPDITAPDHPQAPQAGNPLWTGPRLHGPCASPVIDGNRLLIAGDDALHLLDLRTGRECCHLPPPTPFPGREGGVGGAAMFITTYVPYVATAGEMGQPDVTPASRGLRSAPHPWLMNVTPSGFNQAENDSPDKPQTRRGLVELLAAPGRAGLYLSPPMIVAHLTPPHLPLTRVPADLTLTDSRGHRYTIGDPANPFRRQYLLCIQPEGDRIILVFRTWDVFMPGGIADDAPLTPPCTLTYLPELPSVVSLTPTVNPPLTGLQPVLGAPVPLDGTQDDGTPLYVQGQVVTSTRCGGELRPLLRDSSAKTEPTFPHGGALSGYAPELSATEESPAWQFYGDTIGPREQAAPERWLFSDFPYPPATDGETLYTIGNYHVAGSYGDNAGGQALTETGLSTLYALALPAVTYLCQTATAGTVAAWPPEDKHVLLVRPLPGGPPLAGARVLLQGAGITADLGHVTRLQPHAPFDPANSQYEATVERACPDIDKPATLTLLATTGTPYVSRVQGIGTGICSEPPPGTPANTDPRDGRQEVMIGLLGAHEGQAGSLRSQGDAAPEGTNEGQAGSLRSQVYLPRISTDVAGERQWNYRVDSRAGRIELGPRAAGELADRFVEAHYFTSETINGAVTPVRHTEIMYVPTATKWEYNFRDALPLGGPALVGDTLFVTALRRVAPDRWQPTLYAFAAASDDPYVVAPLSVQALGEPIPLPAEGAPRAAIPVRAAGGLLVNVPGEKNGLTFLTDRGVLVADGQRVLRLDSAGRVTWQALATQDADPAALNSPTPAVRDTGAVRQEFNLLTRLGRLPGGHLLLCDTGASRVVEMGGDGQVAWQYPDSDLTYRDPDTNCGDPARFNPALLRGATPANLRLSLPRDVRRYTREVTVDSLQWAAPSGTARDLGPATVRWETTLIADTGNNRLLEVYRPLVRLHAASLDDGGAVITLARGFHYRPDLFYLAGGQAIYLTQFTEVVADGTSLTWQDGIFPRTLTFTAAMRYPGPDNKLPDTLPDPDPVRSGIRSKELLAVVGNHVMDPLQLTSPLRTVRLSRPAGTLRTEVARHPLLPTANALAMRDRVYDYLQVRQLDLVTVRNGATEEVRALVVDATGVREVPLATERQTTPTFEMTRESYALAVQHCPYWDQAIDQRFPGLPAAEASLRKLRLDAWRNDAEFAPAALQRLDGAGDDPRSARYLIANMPVTGQRAQLFEARWLHPGTPYDGHHLDGWGIIDHKFEYTAMPDPLDPDFPAIPGKTGPLSQPLAISGE